MSLKAHYYNTINSLYENRFALALAGLGAVTVGAVVYGAVEAIPAMQDQLQPDGPVFDQNAVNK